MSILPGTRLPVLRPLILTSNLLLLLGSEIVGNVERLSNLLGRLALDHVGDGLAANVKKRLDIQVVGSLGNEAHGQLSAVHRHGWGEKRTRMISKSISWSTCMNFWSHSSMSVVFLRASDSSSWAWMGSLRWCSHHSITFRITDSLTCPSY